MLKNQKGIAHVILVLVVVACLAAVGVIVYGAVTKNTAKDQGSQSGTTSANVSWDWDGQKWSASGNPPSCPDPLMVKSPTDISKVTAILYPGQIRGQYKAHGGFRFEQATNTVEVVAPMDGQLVEASRYIEQNEHQVLLVFINPCGVMYRLDHLLTLSPTLQAAVDKLPAPKADDSRTTKLEKPVTVKAGEIIATEVGFPRTNNVAFDFGLYDLRKSNGATLTQPQNPNEASLNAYGLCWLNNFSGTEAAKAKSLPAGDSASGKASDYCK